MSRFERVVIDLDGVLCDFVGGVLAEFDRESLLGHWPAGVYCIAEAMGVPISEIVDRCVRKRTSRAAAINWFRELDPYPWVEQLVAMLGDAGRGLCFATAPRLGPVEEYAGKKAWINRHVGAEVPISFVKDKSILARAHWLLIDDSPEECAAFERHGGKAILFPQPWNSNAGEASNQATRIAYVRRELDRLLAYRSGRRHLAGAV